MIQAIAPPPSAAPVPELQVHGDAAEKPRPAPRTSRMSESAAAAAAPAITAPHDPPDTAAWSAAGAAVMLVVVTPPGVMIVVIPSPRLRCCSPHRLAGRHGFARLGRASLHRQGAPARARVRAMRPPK